MSDPPFSFLTPSSEFVLLCQSQIDLLTEGLNADWSAIYLTQGWGENTSTRWLPIAFSPPVEDLGGKNPLNLGQKVPYLPSPWFSLASSSNYQDLELDSSLLLPQTFDSSVSHQIMLPLIYQEIVMGLLVTGRKSPEWESAELLQIEKIAQTLAIARFLDQRQVWYQKQLEIRNQQQKLERDRLDNLFHQLKNPLTALKTFGKLLLKRLLSDSRDVQTVQGILQQGDRIQDLLHQFESEINLLTINSLEPMYLALPQSSVNSLLLPATDLSLDAVGIEEILNPLILSAKAIAQEEDIQLFCDLADNLPKIRANKPGLREVLSNLIDNAIKYTPRGGEVEIQVNLKPQGKDQQGVEILIADSGYGIPLVDQQRVFERYYRGGQESGDIAGTGLGLAIVRTLVEQMQGKIELISPNPKYQNHTYPGTILKVWFPVAEV